MHRYLPGHNAAFSLLELTLVLVIVAILALVATPRFSGATQRSRLEAAAGRIVADLHRGRAEARRTSRSLTVTFDAGGDIVSAPDLPSLKRDGAGYSLELRDGPYQADLRSVDFGGDGEVTFDGYGRPDSGGSVTVAVGDDERTVTLDAHTGEAQVE